MCALLLSSFFHQGSAHGSPLILSLLPIPNLPTWNSNSSYDLYSPYAATCSFFSFSPTNADIDTEIMFLLFSSKYNIVHLFSFLFKFLKLSFAPSSCCMFGSNSRNLSCALFLTQNIRTEEWEG